MYFSPSYGKLLSTTYSWRLHGILNPASKKIEGEGTLLPSEVYDLEMSHVTFTYVS